MSDQKRDETTIGDLGSRRHLRSTQDRAASQNPDVFQVFEDTNLDSAGSDQRSVSTLQDPFTYVSTRARIALYDDLLSAPRIIDIEPAPIIEFIEDIASTTYDHALKLGGGLPYSVIREIAENFIHARFRECTVSVLDKGNTLRFSDQGPGIEKKRLVQQPGFTSATSDMKRYIRGVGSGFPIVKEYLSYRNGYLSIDDNAHDGTVVTLSIHPEPPASSPSATSAPVPAEQNFLWADLSQQSLQTLHIFNEKGILGPSDLIAPLGVSVSTAHRILEDLQKKGLIESAPHRKRILSSAGVAFLETERGNLI